MKLIFENPYSRRRIVERKGCGLVNRLINALPIELHIPGYNYCGPGTKLSKRLERGDKGVNLLDEACREHDIAYSKTKNLDERHQADIKLADAAHQRYKASDSRFGERAAALGVLGAMKAKVKLGMGVRRRRGRARRSKPKQITFQTAMRNALKANSVEPFKRVKKSTIPRIIPIPRKSGGFLPLLFAGLAALGSLIGGGSAVASAVNKAKMATKNLEETKRHNMAMEQVPVGSGMYLKPYRSGLGLDLKPYSKN